MPWGSLRIFISSEQSESEDERAIAIQIIEFLCLDPIASERRSASDKSMKEQNEDEVRNSDVYVGILGSLFSEPTIGEFKVARDQRIPVLIYIKDKPVSKRDKELDDFIRNIRDPNTGLVTENYQNATDLAQKLIIGLSNLLSRKFREARKYEFQELESKTKEIKPKGIIEETPTPSIEADFPRDMAKGGIIQVTAKFKGVCKNGFLDFYLMSPSGKSYWFPDPGSYDSTLDTGRISRSDANLDYDSSWSLIIPSKLEVGEYMAGIGMWEDPEGLPNRGRRVIVEKRLKVNVV